MSISHAFLGVFIELVELFAYFLCCYTWSIIIWWGENERIVQKKIE